MTLADTVLLDGWALLTPQIQTSIRDWLIAAGIEPREHRAHVTVTRRTTLLRTRYYLQVQQLVDHGAASITLEVKRDRRLGWPAWLTALDPALRYRQ